MDEYKMRYTGQDLDDAIELFQKRMQTEEIFLVEAELNPSDNFSVTSMSKTYKEIADALQEHKDVKLLTRILIGKDDNENDAYAYFIGEVVVFRPSHGMIEFSMVADTTLDKGENVYHFRITLTDKESKTTTIKQLSGEERQSVVSPTITVTPIDGGHRVVITDINGEHPPFDVLNGQNGIPATHTWNGTVLTITSASGTSSADLKGAAFAYEDFNPEQLEALKADIVNAVLDALPERIGTWQGGYF